VQDLRAKLPEVSSGAHRTRPVCASGVATGVGSSLRTFLSFRPVARETVRCVKKLESGALSVSEGTATFLTARSTGRWYGSYRMRLV